MEVIFTKSEEVHQHPIDEEKPTEKHDCISKLETKIDKIKDLMKELLILKS